MEDGKSQSTGEPVPERARIAGVEAAVAAGLVPSPAVPSAGPAVPGAAVPGYDLPDWTDPPTGQVPRVLLDLERVGPPPPPLGGPVWREREEDWNDNDTVIAELANTGPVVIAYEESSSDDPFAYDFLEFGDDDAWINETERTAALRPRETEPLVAPAPPAAEADGAVEETAAQPLPEPGPATTPESAPPSRRRHRAGRARPARDSARGPSTPQRPARRVIAAGGARNPVVATLTGLCLAAVVLACFKAGPPEVLALAALAVTLAAAELFAALRGAGHRPATLLGLLGVPGLMVAAYFEGPKAVAVGTAAFFVATMAWYLAGLTRRSPVLNASVTVLAFCWVGVLGSFAGLLLDPRIFPSRHGLAILLGAVIAAVGYDVGGYAVGSRLGRHRLVPSVSPNKTWEGLMGGCLLAVGASAGITGLIHPWDHASAAVFGAIVAVVAPLGDLVESLVKRDLGIKDMGSLLPGHGGMMDRVDALLFVLPAAYCFVRLAHIG